MLRLSLAKRAAMNFDGYKLYFHATSFMIELSARKSVVQRLKIPFSVVFSQLKNKGKKDVVLESLMTIFILASVIVDINEGGSILAHVLSVNASDHLDQHKSSMMKEKIPLDKY